MNGALMICKMASILSTIIALVALMICWLLLFAALLGDGCAAIAIAIVSAIDIVIVARVIRFFVAARRIVCTTLRLSASSRISGETLRGGGAIALLFVVVCFIALHVIVVHFTSRRAV
jgi:hypothetical protein